MVDVSAKEKTLREATASTTVLMKKETLNLIKKNKLAKGDCFGVAKIAGILAAKKVAELIPLTHPLNLTYCDLEFQFIENVVSRFIGQKRTLNELSNYNNLNYGIKIYATVKTKDLTGVEMEALTAAAIAGLTIYDMAKAVDKEMTITDVCLLEKKGGKSGYWKRPFSRSFGRRIGLRG